MEHLLFHLAYIPSTAIPLANRSEEYFCLTMSASLKFWALLKPRVEAEKMVIHWQSLVPPRDTHACTSPSPALSLNRIKAWDPDHRTPVQNDNLPGVCHVLPFSLSTCMAFFFSLTQKYCNTKGRDGTTSKSLSYKGSSFIFTSAEEGFF